MSDELEQLQELRRAIEALEAERDCGAVLARYSFYSDHARRDEWIDLWTQDGAFDLMMYHGGDIVSGEQGEWRRTRFVGHDQLREVIYSPANEGIVGRSQHVVSGPPSTFRLVDSMTAVMVSYSVVYVKHDPDLPVVQYQNHGMNRWLFRKVDGRWYIAENIRRRMGDPASGDLFADF
jgi:hypothetical protein